MHAEKCSCVKCNDADIEQFLIVEDYEPNKKIKWKQWVDADKRLKLIKCNGTISEINFEIKKQLEEVTKNKGSDSCGVLRIDFSENFSITSQDEIQACSGHMNK